MNCSGETRGMKIGELHKRYRALVGYIRFLGRYHRVLRPDCVDYKYIRKRLYQLFTAAYSELLETSEYADYSNPTRKYRRALTFQASIGERIAFLAGTLGMEDIIQLISQLQTDIFLGYDCSNMKGMRQALFTKSIINAGIQGAIVGHQKAALDVLLVALVVLKPRITTIIGELTIPRVVVERSFQKGYDMIDHILQLDHPIGDLMLDAFLEALSGQMQN